MQLFKSICILFKPLGVNPSQANGNHAFNLKNVVVFVFLLQWSLFSWAFFIYKAETLDEFIESFYISVTTMGEVFMWSVTVWKMSNIFDFIDDFGHFVERRFKYLESKAIYEQVNEKVEKWTKILYFMLTIVTLPGVMMPNCIKSCFLYFTTDLGSEAFRTPFPIWLPFDWKTPFGYLLTSSIQFASAYCLVMFAAFRLSFFIASCWTLMATADDIKGHVNHFDRIVKSEENDKKKLKLKELLHQFITLDVDAKQLAADLTEIYGFIITIYFLWSISTICSSLLVVQIQISRGAMNPLELMRPLFLAFWSFVEILMLCNFGEMVINRFNEVNEMISASDWYSFPLEIQRTFSIILMSTQLPIQFRGFGNIELSRDTFKKAANCGFSYFMVLRGFKN